MPSHQHIVVIGSGIIGASIAYHLSKAGAKVTVIEAGEEGGLATPRSWAWINASWGNPEVYFRLRTRSMAEWRRLDAELPALNVNWAGGLIWDLPPPELERFAEEHASWGYDIRRVGGDEAARIEPELANPPELAFHVAEEGAVEPLAAARTFLDAARTLGAAVIAARRVTALSDRGVETDAGLVAADQVVIAAGAGSAVLAASAGYELPMTTPPGLLVSSEPVPKLLNGLMMAPDLHVRQTAQGRLIAGSDFGGGDPGNDPEAAAAGLFDAVKRMLRSGDRLALGHYTVGFRPTPADGYPVVGRLPGNDRVSVAVTHSGITLAPAVGLFLAEEVVEGRREPLLESYRPERFSA